MVTRKVKIFSTWLTIGPVREGDAASVICVLEEEKAEGTGKTRVRLIPPSVVHQVALIIAMSPVNSVLVMKVPIAIQFTYWNWNNCMTLKQNDGTYVGAHCCFYHKKADWRNCLIITADKLQRYFNCTLLKANYLLYLAQVIIPEFCTLFCTFLTAWAGFLRQSGKIMWEHVFWVEFWHHFQF